MTDARKEGWLHSLMEKGNEVMSKATAPSPNSKKVSEGVKHARALEAAIDYYREQLPDGAEESKNWPFSSTVPLIIGQLNNL